MDWLSVMFGFGIGALLGVMLALAVGVGVYLLMRRRPEARPGRKRPFSWNEVRELGDEDDQTVDTLVPMVEDPEQYSALASLSERGYQAFAE